MKKLLPLASLAFALNVSAQTTVVDLQFSPGLALGVETREPTESTASEFFIEWSDTTYLFDNTLANAEGQSKTLYGGVKMTSQNAAFAEGPLVRITDLEDNNFDHIAVVANTEGTEDVQTLHYLFLWGADEFLADAKKFAGSDSTITASTRGVIAPKNAQSRFVIRDGNTYYLSNMLGPASSEETVSISADDAGLEWAPFDPAAFTEFTGDGADLGFQNFSSSEFQARTFENVTGVGIIGYHDREWNGPVLLWLSEFQVKLTE